MDTERIAEFLLPLAETAGRLPPDRLPDVLQLLQQGFIAVFESADASTGGVGSGGGPGSREEARLAVTRAVRAFHTSGPTSDPAFFTAAAYHPAAALFLQRLLLSLTGNSKDWFRTLQVESMGACLAVADCVGWRHARQYAPGVVSATVRYIVRSHLGKDSAAVRHGALDVLARTLLLALSTAEEPEWVAEAVGHLSGTMRGFLEPKAMVENAYDRGSLVRMRQLVADVLASTAMTAQTKGSRTQGDGESGSGSGSGGGSLFARQLVVAYMVVENLLHLSPEPDTAVSVATVALQSDINADDDDNNIFLLVDDSVLRSDPVRSALRDAATELRGVELLHLVTSLVRFPATRDIVISKGDDDNDGGVPLFLAIAKKCVRVAGAQMSPENLYSSRGPRRYPAGVVDECLDRLAHALALLPAPTGEEDDEEDDDEETAGEFLTNALLDGCDAVLSDWDSYAAHPPMIYVLGRLIAWQFKGSASTVSRLPSPADFTASGALEQLWAVMARPHLWDITLDEGLCSHQQVRHRQLVAATTLRVLSVAVGSVLAPAVAGGGTSGRRSFDRFVALALYPVMEKAAAPGIVHSAAMDCVAACVRASGRPDVLDFFLDAGVHVIDDASRAVKEAYLRPAAVSVLRGAMDFAASSLDERAEAVAGGGGEGETSPFSSSSSALPVLVRHRTSAAEVAAVQRRFHRMSVRDTDRMADFTRAAVGVAGDCCRLACLDGDEPGARAALALLRDAFDMAAVLNVCSPLEASDDEQHRKTTSFNARVQLLQEDVAAAILMVLMHCAAAAGPLTAAAVQAVVRGLTAFLTTESAEGWSQRQIAAWNQQRYEQRRARREARERKYGVAATPIFPLDGGEEEQDEDEGEEARMPSLVSPPLPWPAAVSTDGADRIVLLRSHLTTVYRVYLSFSTQLKEPMARFLSYSSSQLKPPRRTAEERRLMEAVPTTPALAATLSGLAALLLLSPEFLEQRMVDEILPVALLWFEKAALPRIPTNTDEQAKTAVRRFAEGLQLACTRPLLRACVVERCGPFFTLPPVVVDLPVPDSELAEVGEGEEEDAAPPGGAVQARWDSDGDSSARTDAAAPPLPAPVRQPVETAAPPVHHDAP